MSKLSDKKNKVVSKLKEFETQISTTHKMSPLDELFYRELLLKLKNYDHSLLRNTKNKKNEIFKEYAHFSQVYIDFLRTEYDQLKNRFQLSGSFSDFEHQQRGSLLQNGLKTVLEKKKRMYNERVKI